jgi:hypothetical protein
MRRRWLCGLMACALLLAGAAHVADTQGGVDRAMSAR